jgi:hypothetical protein
MGGGLASEIICDGDDVLKDLNRIFGDPNSEGYKYAKSNNIFDTVKNASRNYKDLIAAYEKAGLKVSPGWALYLRRLGTVQKDGPQQGPKNIFEIAQFRYNGLINDVPMATDVHVPVNGGHVHIKQGSAAKPITVDSPCPLPDDQSY